MRLTPDPSMVLPICEYTRCFNFADRVVRRTVNGELCLSCDGHPKRTEHIEPTGITINLPPMPWPFWVNHSPSRN